MNIHIDGNVSKCYLIHSAMMTECIAHRTRATPSTDHVLPIKLKLALNQYGLRISHHTQSELVASLLIPIW